MRKKNKKNKLSISVIAKGVTVVFILFILLVFCQKLYISIKNSDYFVIRTVVCHPSLQFIDSGELESLKGKNLFSVNIKEFQRQLQNRHPSISKLRLVRRFPNQIYVMAKQRLPFAKIKAGGRIFSIDDELTILPNTKPGSFILPIIESVNLNKGSFKIGSKLKQKDILVAVEIIRVFNENENLSPHTIDAIDITNLSEIHMRLSNNLNVVLDRENIHHRLEMLATVLLQSKADFNSIKYIDVRFKEPVVKKN